jgi:hypothetical protein
MPFQVICYNYTQRCYHEIENKYTWRDCHFVTPIYHERIANVSTALSCRGFPFDNRLCHKDLPS